MFYDDIAHNKLNPFPGQIFNYNGGPNVYADVPKDYIGENVTVENFLNVLKGNNSSGGKVYTPIQKMIFLYICRDHGGTGFFCFPSEYLWAHTLQNTFNYMAKHKLYKQITVYVESCESGSLFNGVLPNNTKIYALTASSPIESSYACCYNSTMDTLICDCFSINWLMDAETHSPFEETVAIEAYIVELLTNTSTVCEYGDLSVTKDLLSSFLAGKTKQLASDAKNLSQGGMIPVNH